MNTRMKRLYSYFKIISAMKWEIINCLANNDTASCIGGHYIYCHDVLYIDPCPNYIKIHCIWRREDMCRCAVT